MVVFGAECSNVNIFILDFLPPAFVSGFNTTDLLRPKHNFGVPFNFALVDMNSVHFACTLNVIAIPIETEDASTQTDFSRAYPCRTTYYYENTSLLSFCPPVAYIMFNGATHFKASSHKTYKKWSFQGVRKIYWINSHNNIPLESYLSLGLTNKWCTLYIAHVRLPIVRWHSNRERQLTLKWPHIAQPHLLARAKRDTTSFATSVQRWLTVVLRLHGNDTNPKTLTCEHTFLSIAPRSIDVLDSRATIDKPWKSVQWQPSTWGIGMEIKDINHQLVFSNARSVSAIVTRPSIYT